MTLVSNYVGYSILEGYNLSLGVDEGKIISKKKLLEKKENLPIIIPGLIDLQVNGFKGFDLNSDDLEPETVESLSEELCKVGVRKYLPTLITASEKKICDKLKAIKFAKANFQKSKEMIAGVHIEGPSISKKNGPRGAHPKKDIRSLTLNEFNKWYEISGGLIKLITLAPETKGAIEFIKVVSKQNIIVSIGHSDADEEDIIKAVESGARMSTHLGNGVSNYIKRHPNLIWAQLANEKLVASFIADRHHLSKNTLKAMLKAKGFKSSILVSDSVKFAGLPEGKYNSLIGGDVEVSSDGRVSVVNTPYLAGSGSSLLDIFCGFSDFTNLPIKYAALMSCQNPAKLIEIDNNLSIGSSADFILLKKMKNKKRLIVKDIIYKGKSVLVD
ncbi:MAG: N-acetylglucosamine-6-phosphate deacetylase [Paracoccaceae bacterium]